MEELFFIVFLVVMLAVFIAMIASTWVVFQKAGKPGWASIIPIYNMVVMLEIVGKPIWWLFLMFIPLVSIVVAVIILIAMAKSFGKSELFGIGLAFLPFIFFPILGFGKARYIGPSAA